MPSNSSREWVNTGMYDELNLIAGYFSKAKVKEKLIHQTRQFVILCAFPLALYGRMLCGFGMS